jgi:hypothetical protein
LQKFLRRMSKAFSIGLESARQLGQVREDLDLRNAGEFLTGALFGMVVLARAGFPRLTLNAFVDNTMASLMGLGRLGGKFDDFRRRMLEAICVEAHQPRSECGEPSADQ